MTIDTSPVVSKVVVQGFVMAAIAVDFGMCMPEPEFRIIVIEAPDQPCVRVVTLRTILAQAALMDIVATMAVDAFQFGIGEYRGGMAGLAAEGGMLPDERKSSQIVVETDPGLPGLIVVALPTVLAKCALMHVVLAVAASAVGFQFAVFGASDMAGLAFQFSVATVQWKIGFGVMVEHRQVPTPDFVTVTALFTVRSLVSIIFPVTAVTVTDAFIRL